MARSPIETRETDGVAVVSFAPETHLDLAAVDAVAEEINQLAEGARRGIILDFDNVHFVSSPALSLLLNLRRVADASGTEVVFCRLRPEVARLFRITRLDRLFTLHADLDGAVAHFAPRASESSAPD